MAKERPTKKEKESMNRLMKRAKMKGGENTLLEFEE
jgi:hypothetical protein